MVTEKEDQSGNKLIHSMFTWKTIFDGVGLCVLVSPPLAFSRER